MKDIIYKKGLFRVQKSEYQGREFIDVRRFYRDAETEEWKPTRKGITFPLEIATQITEAIVEENK